MTAALPAAMAAWAPWLTWFSAGLRDQIAPLVQRLHPLLAGARQRVFETLGEPDGFDGLRRRGSYERLIGTEWLLADEWPDEFLRRAAVGEHLFFAPKPKGQRTQRLIVALFDAGPAQLGAPRLAHLAVWILLARRAAQVGGQFRWGVMQVPGVLHDALLPADLTKLLGSRSFEPAAPDHLSQWHRHFEGGAVDPQECWSVGALTAVGPPGVATPVSHRLGIGRPLHGESLDVALLDGGARRSVSLPLPAGAEAAHLLKGLFVERVDAGVIGKVDKRVSISHAPVIAASGSKVAVALLDGGGALLFSTAKDRRDRAGDPKEQRWGLGQRPLTLTLVGKKLMALHTDATSVRIWQANQFGAMPRPPVDEFEAAPATRHWLPSASLNRGAAQRYLVLDQGGRLVRWMANGPGKPTQFDVIDTGVLGLFQLSDNAAVYVARDAQGLVAHWTQGGPPGLYTTRVRVPDSAADAVLFGDGMSWRDRIGPCAIRVQRGPFEQWRWHTPLNTRSRAASNQPASDMFTTTEVALSPGETAIGLAASTSASFGGLVVIGADRQRLLVHNGTRQEVLYRAPGAITAATACPVSGVVAMLTQRRQLIVFDIVQGTLRVLAQTAEGGGE